MGVRWKISEINIITLDQTWQPFADLHFNLNELQTCLIKYFPINKPADEVDSAGMVSSLILTCTLWGKPLPPSTHYSPSTLHL